MTASSPVSAVWAALVSGGFAGGGIPYIAADNTTAIDISNLFYDATNKRLQFITNGDMTGTDSINSYAQQDTFQFQSQVPGASPWLSALPAGMTVSSSRGNANLPTALQTGDFVGGFFAWGYLPILNPTYVPVAGTWGVIRGVGTAGDGNLGGELHFGTKADSGIFTDLGFIDAAGVFRPTVNEGMQLGKTAFGWAQLFLGFQASGGVGAQVINKSSGRTGIAAGQTAVVITNNKVSATSIVLPVLETVDATAKSVVASPGAGSVTFTLNAACTAQVSVGFVVVGN